MTFLFYYQNILIFKFLTSNKCVGRYLIWLFSIPVLLCCWEFWHHTTFHQSCVSVPTHASVTRTEQIWWNQSPSIGQSLCLSLPKNISFWFVAVFIRDTIVQKVHLRFFIFLWNKSVILKIYFYHSNLDTQNIYNCKIQKKRFLVQITRISFNI